MGKQQGSLSSACGAIYVCPKAYDLYPEGCFQYKQGLSLWSKHLYPEGMVIAGSHGGEPTTK